MNELIATVAENLKEKLLQDLLPVIQEKGGELISKIKENPIDFIKEFLKGFQSSNANTVYESIETISKDKLIEIAKSHIVPNATEIAAYKTETEDAFVIYLAYTKDKELLDIENNCYIIIKSNALAKDIVNLFGDDKLIILT